MSETEFQRTQTAADQTTNSNAPIEDSPGLIWIQTLGPIVLFNTALRVLERWIPAYLALGISALLTGLLWYPIRGVRNRRYGFGKWLLIVVLISAGVTTLDYLFTEVFKL